MQILDSSLYNGVGLGCSPRRLAVRTPKTMIKNNNKNTVDFTKQISLKLCRIKISDELHAFVAVCVTD